MKSRYNNSISGRIAAFALLMISLLFQWYQFPTYYRQIVFCLSQETALGQVSRIDEGQIEITFANSVGTDVSFVRGLENKNPYRKVKVHQQMEILYSNDVEGVYRIVGYEEKPVLLFLVLIIAVTMVAQLGFILVIFNLACEQDLKFQ